MINTSTGSVPNMYNNKGKHLSVLFTVVMYLVFQLFDFLHLFYDICVIHHSTSKHRERFLGRWGLLLIDNYNYMNAWFR